VGGCGVGGDGIERWLQAAAFDVQGTSEGVDGYERLGDHRLDVILYGAHLAPPWLAGT
jgi:hypothetical protein